MSMDPLPGTKEAEQALSNLAGQGILGSVCVLLAIALFLTIRSLLKSKDDRLADQKSMAEALGKVNDAAKDLAIEMKSHAAGQMIEANKTQDALRGALVGQERAFGELRGTVNTLQVEQTRLVTSLNIKHGKTG